MRQIKRYVFIVLTAALMFCLMPAVNAKAANEHGYAGKVWWYHYDKSDELLIGYENDPEVDMPDYENLNDSPWAAKSWYSGIKKIIIRKNVKSIGDCAFAESNVEEVKFEDNSACTAIGAFAFDCCTSLKTISFGSNSKLSLIDRFAFSECDSLESISLPSSLKKINSGAFQITGLKRITIPKKCTSLGRCVFMWCPNLKSISVNSKNKSLSSKNGVLFNKKKTKLIQYPTAKKGSTYTVPSSVTKITDYAFSGSEGLAIYPKVKTLKMSKKIKNIGEGAFDYTNIKKIYFPRNRPKIEGGRMFDSDMVVTIFYKRAKWPKKYRKNYGALKVKWKSY